jgi:hypothetical protein
MIHIRCCIITLLVASVFGAGCEPVADYSGDGKLIDNGARASTDRYVVDLGSVSLKSAGTSTFRLKNLAKENFVIGFELQAPPGSQLEQAAIAPVVSIALKQAGKSLVNKEGSLSQWAWSVKSPGDRAFVYGRDKPDTYFDALPGKDYELTLQVKQPDRGGAHYTASLVVKSGGWK